MAELPRVARPCAVAAAVAGVAHPPRVAVTQQLRQVMNDCSPVGSGPGSWGQPTSIHGLILSGQIVLVFNKN